jgi:predicted Zn-dependent protease
MKHRVAGALVAVALAAAATFSMAAPHRADPDLVVLHVDPSRSAIQATALDLDDALVVASRLIDAGRRTTEARYIGRAEALLESWRERATASARWHVLAADIHQYRHDYSRALRLLGQAIELEPKNERALLMRAAIHQVQGNYKAARRDCAKLIGLGESLLGTSCLAQVLGFTGQLEGASRLLESLLPDSGANAPPAIRSWILSALADMHDRRGNVRSAERLLRDAVAIEPHSLYLRLALADLLLAHGRPLEAPRALVGLPLSPAVRLRIAEAEHALGEPVAAQLEPVLRAFDEARLRGERLEQQEVARLARLQVRRTEALAAARANWSVQREPVDLRLLIATAIDAGDARTLSEARAWIATTGYQDVIAEAWLAGRSRTRVHAGGSGPATARAPG